MQSPKGSMREGLRRLLSVRQRDNNRKTPAKPNSRQYQQFEATVVDIDASATVTTGYESGSSKGSQSGDTSPAPSSGQLRKRSRIVSDASSQPFSLVQGKQHQLD